MRWMVALTITGLGIAAATLPLPAASALCELPTGQPCPQVCQPVMAYYDKAESKVEALPDMQCWT